MKKCPNCSVEMLDEKRFCTECGTELPLAFEQKDVEPAEVSKQISNSKAANAAPINAPQEGKSADKAVVFKTVVKAASKAIAKSLTLSAVILGPGFLMLLSGLRIPGMIWLFVGSFGLMAWTYRKPWRLGWISCLTPPVAAGLCYFLQLWLFGAVSPPLILVLIAVGIGIGVGQWRAKTHVVKQSDDGSFVAERTIGYLLVWVAAYGVTQTLALLAANIYVVRAGLITGAFSTAMLAVVSLVIWRQFKVLRGVVATLALCAGFLNFSPNLAEAQGSTFPAWQNDIVEIARQEMMSVASASGLCGTSRLRKSIVTNAARTPLLQLTCNRTKFEFTHNLLEISQAGFDDYKNAIGKTTDHTPSATRRRMSSFEQTAQYYYHLVTNWSQQTTNSSHHQWENAPLTAISKSSFVCNGECDKDSKIGNSRISVTVSTEKAIPSTSMIDLGSNAAARKIMQNLSPKIDGYLKRKFQQHTGPLGGARASGGSNRPMSGPVTPQQAAKVAAAVSTILVAAGVAVHVAQAVAAAIANALQAGVQLTAEEIQAAVTEALLTFGPKKPEVPETDTDPPNYGSSGEDDDKPPDNGAQQNKTPILDPNGDPYPMDEDGKYWGPDGKGGWGWMTREDALKAAAEEKRQADERQALADYEREERERIERERKEEERQRKLEEEKEARRLAAYERDRDARFNKGAQEDMTRSGENMRRETQEEIAQEKREKEGKPEPKAPVNPEEAERARLGTGIENTLNEMENGAEKAEAFARLDKLRKEGDTQGMRNLWAVWREERGVQQQEANTDAAQKGEAAKKAQSQENAVTLARDFLGAGLAAGVSVATGGTASVLQAAGAAAVGTGGLIAMGGAEGGIKAKGGKVTFDPWGAKQGMARGAAKAAGAMVGGVSAGGSKGVVAAKTLFGAGSTYSTTYADTVNAGGSRELAASRASWAAAGDALKSLGGEAFDEKLRRSGLHAKDVKGNMPEGFNDAGPADWAETIDALHNGEKMRINAAKTASNILGNTLTDIAKSDRDLTTQQATTGAAKAEAMGLIAGKVIGLGDQQTPLTPEQQSVANRLNAERQGTSTPAKMTPEYAAHLRSTGQEPGDFVNAPSRPGDTGGFNLNARKHAQRVADDLGLTIFSRPVESEGQQAIARGEALPKPPPVKANTGKDIDTLLGMDPKNKNRVVVFEPKLPPQASLKDGAGRPMSDADYSNLKARAQMRGAQFESQTAKLKTSDQFAIKGQLLVDKKTGLPFASDNDVFEIRGMHGEPVPKAVSQEAMRRLMRDPSMMGQNIASTVEHREHNAWRIDQLDRSNVGADGKTEHQRAAEINARILESVRPGEQGLVHFTARPGMTPPIVGRSSYTGVGPETGANLAPDRGDDNDE